VVDKLGLYNAALTEVGERVLGSLAENTEARRVLDAVYDNVVADCLTSGGWNFATQSIQAESDTGVAPSFGYQQVFTKPSDWVRTLAVSADEYFTTPLLEYFDDPSIWSADISPIYVRYVSNDTGLGRDLTKWPRSFTRYVELELASRILPRVNQNASLKETINKDRDRARRAALNEDAMNEAQPKFPPPGSWTLSRRSAATSGSDRGSRNRLIG
jgi:hypothetical protein